MRSLLLLRHGQAEGTARGGDAERRLTRQGGVIVEGVARAMNRMDLRPSAVWHSPYRRAVETATLVAPLTGAPALLAHSDLSPHGAASPLAERLLRDAPDRLLVVSHLPLLPELIAELLGVPLRLDIGTASLVHLTLLSPGLGHVPAFLSGFFPGEALAQLG